MNVIHPIEKTIFEIPVLYGAAEELVQHREQRGNYVAKTGYIKRKKFGGKYNASRTTSGYFTNQSIKHWSTWFLLKGITNSGYIKDWIKQKEYLLNFCKTTETTFRTHLNALIELELISIESDYSITLTSYENAADILGIHFSGTYKINYDIHEENNQTFQYLLRAEEMRTNQHVQLEALVLKLDKNPTIMDWCMPIFNKDGYSENNLKNDPKLLQTLLFKLQQEAFIYGSDIYEIIHRLRADINRGVECCAKQHSYKSAQSVSYLKSVLINQGIISVEKKFIESKKRCRLYIPKVNETDARNEGTKYLKHQKKTGWRLTDQVTIKSKSTNEIKKNTLASQAVA